VGQNENLNIGLFGVDEGGENSGFGAPKQSQEVFESSCSVRLFPSFSVLRFAAMFSPLQVSPSSLKLT
jgi:hypothetical protein